jgi:HK97 gp10 family phage protein
MKWKVNQQAVENIKIKSDQYTQKIVNETADHAKDFCPVDTGALRDSIEVNNKGNGIYTYGSKKSYARIIEFGSRYQSPQPFLRPALALTKSNHNS